MKTYLISNSSIEKNGDLIFINLGDFNIALSTTHALILAQGILKVVG